MRELGEDIQRVMVTGGAGFIGSAVIKELQSRGIEVAVVDDLSFGNRDFVDVDDLNFYIHDIREKEPLIAIFDDFEPDWIIHLAAVHFIPWCNEHPYQASDINIQAREIMRIKQILNGILAKHSGRNIDDLEKDTDRDNFMSANQAAEYGLIDEVVTHAK